MVNIPNLFWKLTPIDYWARLWPPLTAFQGPGPGYLKYHLYFWAVGRESTDLTRQSCPRSLPKAAGGVCTGSPQSSVPLHSAFSAEQAWQLVCQRNGNEMPQCSQLWEEGRSSVAQTQDKSPLVLLPVDWMCLWAPVPSLSGWGDTSIGNWLNLEPCFITYPRIYAANKARTRSQIIRI